MSSLLQILRPFLRRPAFTLVVVATLAVGIGANTAIFSLVHGTLLQPLPYEDPDRLMTVWEDHSARGGPADEWTGYMTFRDWRDESTVWDALAAYGGWRPSLSADDGSREQLTGLAVTEQWFRVLGVEPSQGRSFRAEEDQPGGEPVAILSHALWQGRFGGDAEVVGRTLDLDGEATTIVGVLPESFEPLFDGVEIWRPLALDPARNDRGGYYIQVVGRLAEGVGLERARADMARVAEVVAEKAPAQYEDVGVRLIPLHDRLVGAAKPALLALSGAVGLLLLVACANVANLLLVHAVSRRREMAVRVSLGAGRLRLAGRLATECLVLAVAGGAAGLLLASWGTRVLVAMAPAGTPRIDEVSMNATAVVFALTLSLLTGLAFGVVPAWHGSEARPARWLRPGGRVESAGLGRLRGALVVAETALALCLLLGAGLLAKSFWGLTQVDVGFDPDGVVATNVRLPPATYDERQERIDLFSRLATALESQPGVESVGVSSSLPMSGAGSDFSYYVEGADPAPEGHEPSAWYRMVSAGYFDTLGIRRLEGRPFDAGQDHREAARVVAVSERFAQRWFGDETPIGQRMKIGGHESERDWMTIVAVIEDVHDRSPMLPTRDDVYLPFSQYGPLQMSVSVRSATADLASIAPLLRRELRRLDPAISLSDPSRLADTVSATLWLPRLAGQVVSVFAAAALLLASLGVYGVLAHLVTLRRKETGIRMALGADARRIVGLVLRQGLKLATVGLILGFGLAALVFEALAGTFEGLLYGVEPADPAILGATSAVLLAAAALASWVPARRASRTDPAECLREE